MVTGNRNGRFTLEVEDTARRLRKRLGVRVEAMEDAFCKLAEAAEIKSFLLSCGYPAATVNQRITAIRKLALSIHFCPVRYQVSGACSTFCDLLRR